MPLTVIKYFKQLKKSMIEYCLYLNNFDSICRELYFENIHNEGAMLDWYRGSLYYSCKNYSIRAIATAKTDHYIGACVLLNELDDGNNIGVYVRPEFRRRKIGSELVKMVQYVNKNPLAWKGSDCSKAFYNSLSL